MKLTKIKSNMTKIFFKWLLLSLIIGIGFSSGINAQINKGETINKIVAIVGNEVILKSDIDGQIAYMMLRDKSVNPNDPKLIKEVLDGMIDQLLITTKAIEDSVTVSEDEITQRLDLHIQSEIQRFGSEKRVEQVYGMSVARIKSEVRDQIKNNLLARSLIQKKFGEVAVTGTEVKEFYDKFKDSLPSLPKMVELYHIVKFVQSQAQSKEQVLNLAKEIRDSIIKGGDFAVFAKNHSADLNTAKEGGELGWFDKGKLLPEFEKVAFNLNINEISNPVETPFGFHIIQTLEKKANSIRTRHILFKIGQSSEDQEVAKKILSDMKKRYKEGEAFEELARKFSDEKESRGFGGFVGKIPLTEIPASISSVVSNMNEGEVSDPIPYNTDPLKPAFHVVYKKRIIPERFPTLDSDYTEIEQKAIEYKKSKLYSDWLTQLRKEMYWEIKN